MIKTQKYTSPTQKSNTRIITIALVISWLLILAGVRRVFFRQPSTSTTTPTTEVTTGTTTRRFIGEKVLFAGTIKQNESFTSSYSHLFTTNTGREFGLKSADIDLFLYTGSVELKGEIADFAGDLPIIQVDEIVGSSSKDDLSGTGRVEGNEDFFYSDEDNIGFDLSAVEGYEIMESGADIRLVDTENDETVLSVSTFECITGDPLQDCSALQQKFKDLNNETFTSSQNITFYNLTETNTRIAFNDSNQGYTVRPQNTEALTNFIGFMQFLTPSSLLAFVEENKESCKAIGSVLDVVTEASFEETQPGLLVASINGLSTDGKEVTCEMSIRLGSKLTVRNATIETGNQEIELDKEEEADENGAEVIEDDEGGIEDESDGDTDAEDGNDENAEPAQPEQNPTSNSAEGIAQDVTTVERPESLQGRLSYQSVRGYTVWFSSQAISYGGEILEQQEDFGLSDLTCIYKVQITSRQQAETLSTNPDVEIYECIGTLSESQATSRSLQIIGSGQGKVFVAKFLTTNLDPLTLWVDAPELEEENQ